MILANRLDKRVIIKRPRNSDDPPPQTDEYNQPIDDPIEVCRVWAAIEPLQGNEFFEAKRENVEVSTRIRIRYRVGIDRTMFVSYGDHEFEILNIINPKFQNKELQLMSKERQ